MMTDAFDKPVAAIHAPGTVAEERPSYHHGRLREAMIEATIELVEEIGPEQVTMREAARRAGVSSAAPFRHFANKTALMTAVAEEAMRRLQAEVGTALADVTDEDPLVRLSALGKAYMIWVVRNPTHFKIMSDRRIIDFEGSNTLVQGTIAIQRLMETALMEAAEQGLLRSDDIMGIRLDSRAITYGVARMYVDGQLAQWDVADEDAEAAMAAVLRRFINNLAVDPERHTLKV
jgi:AcrR family transcriptional regulator